MAPDNAFCSLQTAHRISAPQCIATYLPKRLILHTHTHTHVQMGQMGKWTHTHTYSHSHRHTHSCTHTHMHTHTHTHTRTHARTHTHTHTHTHIKELWLPHLSQCVRYVNQVCILFILTSRGVLVI